MQKYANKSRITIKNSHKKFTEKITDGKITLKISAEAVLEPGIQEQSR